MSAEIEADVRRAFTLFEVNPTDPKVAQLASRVLTQMPDLSGMQILLAQHRYALGEVDEARRLLLDVVGRRDEDFAWAAAELLSLERSEDNLAEAIRWAEAVRKESPEDWSAVMDLGGLTALNGDLEAGWAMLDDAVGMAAQTDLDNLPTALLLRAMHLQITGAPPDRFVPAAEEAMRADAANDTVKVTLIWSYLLQGRFADAEETALRELRLRPTDTALSTPLSVLRQLREAVESNGRTLDDVHRSGIFRLTWAQVREANLGIGVAAALAALEPVLPEGVRATLLPPMDDDAAAGAAMDHDIAVWHDGQQVGAGDAWGLPGNFRLMRSDEVEALDSAAGDDPVSYPEWQSDLGGVADTAIMTDDDGGYLVELVSGPVVIRRDGADEVVADSLSSWFWERVTMFGGTDPRPPSARVGSRAALR